MTYIIFGLITTLNLCPLTQNPGDATGYGRRNKLAGRPYKNRLARQVSATYSTCPNGFHGFLRIIWLKRYCRIDLEWLPQSTINSRCNLLLSNQVKWCNDIDYSIKRHAATHPPQGPGLGTSAPHSLLFLLYVLTQNDQIWRRNAHGKGLVFRQQSTPPFHRGGTPALPNFCGSPLLIPGTL